MRQVRRKGYTDLNSTISTAESGVTTSDSHICSSRWAACRTPASATSYTKAHGPDKSQHRAAYWPAEKI